VISKKKVKKKRISGDAYDKNKPAIYIYMVPKSKSNQGSIVLWSPHRAS